MRRYTTRHEDLSFLVARHLDATRAWAVGDPCCTYGGRTDDPSSWTMVASIDGDIITLANGDTLHRTKMRTRSTDLLK